MKLVSKVEEIGNVVRVPMTRGLGFTDLLKRTYKEARKDHLDAFAGNLTYKGLFALFPFSVFLLSLLGLFGVPEFLGTLFDRAYVVLPEGAGAFLEDQLLGIAASKAKGVFTVGAIFSLLLTLWGVSGAFPRSEVDHDRHLVRYRGRPQICNHCPSKTDCTDSDEGREVIRVINPWPHSEAGRFHRGISLSVAGIAALILAFELVRNHASVEILILGTALAATFAVARHMHKAFRASPANFPVPATPPPAPIPTEALRTGYRKGKQTQQ